MSRKAKGFFLGLALLIGLSGCYQAFPTSSAVLQSTYTYNQFIIFSSSARDFTWYFDGALLTDQTTNSYRYFAYNSDIGEHTIKVAFNDGGIATEKTWAVTVH